MQKVKLLISYDGANYSGWQTQPNGVSIQSTLKEALKTIFDEEIELIGSGRTDAGVHAVGQVAHFETEKPLDLFRLRRQINGLLPDDIRVMDLEFVESGFHAQRSATRKEYHYHLWLKSEISPVVRPYRFHVRRECDVALLKEAAQVFVGTHDFATFANVGSTAKTTVRTIYRLDVVEEEGGVRLEFEGNGFLYKMVRNITGALVEVATGRKSLDDLYTLLEGKDRRIAGVAAPAKGLFLMKVSY